MFGKEDYYMLFEQGTVEKTSGDRAFVRVKKSSACAHCDSSESCGISGRNMLIEIHNLPNVKEGDIVEIGVNEGSFLKISFLVYLLPVLALILGALGGAHFSTALKADQSLCAIIAGGILFLLTFLGLKLFERSKNGSSLYLPRITRIIKSGKTCDNI